MKNEIMTKASRLMNSVSLGLKKNSPAIFMTLGIAGTIGSTVLACKATMKINDIIDEKNKTLDDIHKVLEDPAYADKYTEEDSKKDLTILYTQTGVKLLKLYAPAIGLGVASIGCLVMGQRILNKRNAALASAYLTVDRSFKRYRKNVIEHFGQEIDREMRYGIKAKRVEQFEEDKNGKKKKVGDTIEYEVTNPMDGISEYARYFNKSCSDYTSDPEFNLMFLRRQQDWANEVLKNRGHLFLNEVYDMLGIPRTKAGQVVGWIYDKKNDIGDNYVDFGIYDPTREGSRRFVNGLEPDILLDFNVDGPIYEMI